VSGAIVVIATFARVIASYREEQMELEITYCQQ